MKVHHKLPWLGSNLRSWLGYNGDLDEARIAPPMPVLALVAEKETEKFNKRPAISTRKVIVPRNPQSFLLKEQKSGSQEILKKRISNK